MKKDKNADQRRRCIEYILRTQSLPEAQKLRKKDGFAANFSVWLSACAELLTHGLEPWKETQSVKDQDKKN